MLARGQSLLSGTQLEKEWDKVIQVLLEAYEGGTFRYYCDSRIITDGESYTEQWGTPGNYTKITPNLLGKDGATLAGTAGGTKTFEVTPRYIYGWETLSAYDRRGLVIREDSWFMTNLIDALMVAEDICIVEALEEVDTLLPAENILGDPNKPLYHPDNLHQFKALLYLANRRFRNKRTKGNFGAWCLIHGLDWCKVALMTPQGNGAIFASNEYSQITGINGITYSTVCGVALEEVYELDSAYGDGDRDYLVEPGTIRVCTVNNIKFVSYENDTVREAKDSLLNGHTFIMEVAKSVGAKVKNVKGVWLMKTKQELTLKDISPVLPGQSGNPIYTTSVTIGP